MSASFTVNSVEVPIRHLVSPHLSTRLTPPSVLQTPWFQSELRCNRGQSNSLGLR